MCLKLCLRTLTEHERLDAFYAVNPKTTLQRNLFHNITSHDVLINTVLLHMIEVKALPSLWGCQV